MKYTARILCLIIAACLLTTGRIDAQEWKAAAREAASKWQKAVITIKIVAKMKSSRSEEQNQLEVTGSIIDPSGLAVVSAQTVDPAGMIKAYLSSTGRTNSPEQLKFDSEITETTFILDDGTEIEADFVLKDADLDLAFIKPRSAPAQPFAYIPLGAPGKELQLLDDLFVIQRLSRSEGRATSVTAGMVEAVVKGPRTFYIANQEMTANSLGCIAFSSSGKPVGIVVSRPRQNLGDRGMGMMMNMIMGNGMGGVGSIQILRPLQDLLEDVAQAKEAKPPQTAPFSQ